MPNGPAQTDALLFCTSFPFLYFPLSVALSPSISELSLYPCFVISLYVTAPLLCYIPHEFSRTYSVQYLRIIFSFFSSFFLPPSSSEQWQHIFWLNSLQKEGYFYMCLCIIICERSYFSPYVSVYTLAGAMTEQALVFVFRSTSWRSVTVNKVSVCEDGLKASPECHSMLLI